MVCSALDVIKLHTYVHVLMHVRCSRAWHDTSVWIDQGFYLSNFSPLLPTLVHVHTCSNALNGLRNRT